MLVGDCVEMKFIARCGQHNSGISSRYSVEDVKERSYAEILFERLVYKRNRIIVSKKSS